MEINVQEAKMFHHIQWGTSEEFPLQILKAVLDTFSRIVQKTGGNSRGQPGQTRSYQWSAVSRLLYVHQYKKAFLCGMHF